MRKPPTILRNPQRKPSNLRNLGSSERGDGKSKDDRAIIRRLRIKNIPRLQEIFWDSVGFVEEDNYITKLSLCAKNLKEIPPFIFDLNKITSLNLRSNRITVIPPKIRNLKNLKVLILENNRIDSLPSEIFELSELEYLDLDGNDLEILSPAIEKLKNLKKLYLSHNQLHFLPNELTRLSDLRLIYANDNRLEVLPSSIGDLNCLTTIWVKNNMLRTIPLSFKNLTTLQRYDLSNNPWQDPGTEIISKGLGAIQHYLEEKRVQKIIRLVRAIRSDIPVLSEEDFFESILHFRTLLEHNIKKNRNHIACKVQEHLLDRSYVKLPKSELGIYL